MGVPNAAIDLLTAPMRGWQADQVAWAFTFAGVPIERAGYSLFLGSGAGVRELVISGGCSGIRSLVAVSALAALLGHLQQLPPGRRLFLFVAAATTVTVGNFVRLSVTALAGLHWPADVITRVHDWAGLALIPVMVAALIATTRALEPAREASHV